MKEPETRYVAVGDADVAYKVIGDGPIDLLYGYGLGSHLDYFWEYEMTRNVFLRLAEFSRLIFFDRRGTGASDGVPGNALRTWEEWTENRYRIEPDRALSDPVIPHSTTSHLLGDQSLR